MFPFYEFCGKFAALSGEFCSALERDRLEMHFK